MIESWRRYEAMKKASTRRFWAAWVGFVLAAFAATSDSAACSLAFSPISVASRFKVRVSGFDGGPVKGLLLSLTDPEGHALSAVTDDSGIAEFSDTPSGTQYLNANPDNGYGLKLEVSPNGPKSAVVTMRWPAIEPIHVRSLSGTMRAPDANPGQVEQSILALDLLDGISGRILSSTSTTRRGGFDFGKVAPGLYFIRLKPYSAFQQSGGLMSVAVDPSAPARSDKLDLSLTWTSCGLMYTDLRHCPQPDLHVKKLQGHASDNTGRPVQRAEIVLLDRAQNQVAHVSTDSDGNFLFPDPLVGTFELRIDGGGFNPVHTSLHIEPTARDSSLEIDAAYGLTCSGVWAK